MSIWLNLLGACNSIYMNRVVDMCLHVLLRRVLLTHPNSWWVTHGLSHTPGSTPRSLRLGFAVPSSGQQHVLIAPNTSLLLVFFLLTYKLIISTIARSCGQRVRRPQPHLHSAAGIPSGRGSCSCYCLIFWWWRSWCVKRCKEAAMLPVGGKHACFSISHVLYIFTSDATFSCISVPTLPLPIPI